MFWPVPHATNNPAEAGATIYVTPCLAISQPQKVCASFPLISGAFTPRVRALCDPFYPSLQLPR